jgi:hypothetical protein
VTRRLRVPAAFPSPSTRGLLALVLGAAIGIWGACDRHPPEREPPPRAEAPAAVEEFARALDEIFVFPEVGRRYATALRDPAAISRYAGMRSPSALAAGVTADLQAVHPDGHLRLHPPRARDHWPSGSRSERSGVAGTGWVAEGIAYIAFTEFPGNDATRRDIQTFLADHAAARTLILDLRVHGGGFLNEMDVLFSHLYDERTVLVHMETRAAAFREGIPDPHLLRLAAPATIVRQAHVVLPAEPRSPLTQAEVVVLTSGYTGSAAEHLALALRRTGRATLIGETTAGAGHYGRVLDLAGGFTAVVPVGRTFDPDTDEGWEGIGVAPHIEVSATRALREALLRSGVSAGEAERKSRQFRPSGSMDRILPLRPSRPQPARDAGCQSVRRRGAETGARRFCLGRCLAFGSGQLPNTARHEPRHPSRCSEGWM